MAIRVSRRRLLTLVTAALAPRSVHARVPLPASADVVIVGGDPAAFAAAFRLSRSEGLRVVFVHDGPAWRPRPSPPPSSVADLPAYARGHERCFDAWRDAGNAGWGFDDVLPSFKRLERYEGGENDLRGGRGPVAVAHCWDPHALHRAFLLGTVTAGFHQDARHDFNRRRSQGVAGYYQKTHTDLGPQSLSEALLEPAVVAGTIVVPDTVVSRVVVERGRAIGVELLHEGTRKVIRADRAVLVAATPVRAAQILQLSGLGPADVLRAAGIAVVADLPGVGRNLHAQVRLPVRWRATDAALALPASTVTAGMFTVSLSASPPDLQMDLIDPRAARGPWTGIDVTLVQPVSRGVVRVRSADPNAAPAVDAPAVTDSADVRALVQGVRLARLVMEGTALDRLRTVERDDTRGASSQAALESLVRAVARETSDAAGTCALGPEGDRAAVVDAQLAVNGVGGLYVAGTAVMPSVVNAPPDAAALMTGDRAADGLARGRA